MRDGPADHRKFLELVRDDESVFPLVKEIGYGWAIEMGLVRKTSEVALDFVLTERGKEYLADLIKRKR